MSQFKKIRKVVFPVGGLGTRFLPATKSIAKEMLPIVDKPLIHHAYEEAMAAGIEQFIFITGRNKHAISDHFDHSFELQSILDSKNKKHELELTRDFFARGRQYYVYTPATAPRAGPCGVVRAGGHWR